MPPLVLIKKENDAKQEEIVVLDKDDNLFSNNRAIIDHGGTTIDNHSLQTKESLNYNDFENNHSSEIKELENRTNQQPHILLDKEDDIDSNKQKEGEENSNNNSNNKESFFQKNMDTPPESVTSVPSVTNFPPRYPCMFCTDYFTNIDFDMEIHLREKHKERLLNLPIKGNLDKREEYVVALIKRKMIANSVEEEEGE